MYITVENICFTYENSKTETLSNFSLNIEKGEVISILGRSGSGKSTVLRILAGLEMPIKGQFRVDNRIIFDERHFVQPEQRGIGMVFQDYALFPHMTVKENVLFGVSHLSKQERELRLHELLRLVELEDFALRYPHQLSGGQQQRVAIARALAPNPSLLLLDEPFSNLDAELQVKIRKELRDILKQAGVTSIFVTHDENDAHAIADRIVKLKDGHIEIVGRPCDLLGIPIQKREKAILTENKEVIPM